MSTPVKRSKAISKIKREKAQIIFWQETHLTDQEHEKIKSMGFKHTYYSSFKAGRKRGMAILIPNKVHFEFQSEIKDKEGRFIMVKGKLYDKDMTLLNVYVPQAATKHFTREYLMQ